MKKVYAVGVLRLNNTNNRGPLISDQRLWHFFAKFEEAEKCVLENRGDLFEYYYNYALIEETYVIDSEDKPEPGEFGGFPKEWWYVADYSVNKPDEKTGWSEPVIRACEKPSVLKKVVYFWSG